jgi:hypothetical protein
MEMLKNSIVFDGIPKFQEAYTNIFLENKTIYKDKSFVDVENIK